MKTTSCAPQVPRTAEQARKCRDGTRCQACGMVLCVEKLIALFDDQEWLRTLVTAVVALAAAWIGARVGAKATLTASAKATEHDRAMRRFEHTLEAAEQLLDELWPVVNRTMERRIRPGREADKAVTRDLAHRAYRLSNRAVADDPQLARLGNEYAAVLSPGAQWEDVFTYSCVVSGAVTHWVQRREDFRRKNWDLHEWHVEFDRDAQGRPTELLAHEAYQAPRQGL